MLSVMLVASITVHRKNGLFATNNGIELPLLYSTAAIGISLTGPGRYSLDQAFGDYVLLTPKATWIILALGLIGGFANLAMRRPTPASPTV
jgi:putative oxidoreductase